MGDFGVLVVSEVRELRICYLIGFPRLLEEASTVDLTTLGLSWVVGTSPDVEMS